MYGDCGSAQNAPLTFPGSYYAEFTSFLDGSNPGPSGCTGSDLPGPDAVTPIEVPAGHTVTVDVEMPGADPALYFLFECDDALSCPSGSDVPGSSESVSYTNQSSSPERIYVVVDTAGDALTAYRMDIDFQ